MSSSVNNNSITAITNSIDLGPGGSLQFQFAKLQLALAMISKQGAMDYIDQIQQSQDEQKKISGMIQEARQLQSNTTKNASTSMSLATKTYMNNNNLAYTTAPASNNTIYINKDEWDLAIQSLQAQMDKVGSNTQQLMVFVQDFMGQYNSYLQGANSVIQQSNQTLGELARAR